jgi:preprotein translocase subunit Sec61beta
MNWHKGFFRLWCMLSLCWVISIGVYAFIGEQRVEAFNHCLKDEDGVTKELQRAQGRDTSAGLISFCSYSSGHATDDPFAELGVRDNPDVNTQTRVKYVKEYAQLITLPPLVTLALGLLVAWVVSGFKSMRKRTDLGGGESKP